MSGFAIASRLMVEYGLSQDAADFAADQILLAAERNGDQEGSWGMLCRDAAPGTACRKSFTQWLT